MISLVVGHLEDLVPGYSNSRAVSAEQGHELDLMNLIWKIKGQGIAIPERSMQSRDTTDSHVAGLQMSLSTSTLHTFQSGNGDAMDIEAVTCCCALTHSSNGVL